jgi:acyl-CoA thioesterase I
MSPKILATQLAGLILLVVAPISSVLSQPNALAILGSSTAAGTGATQPHQSWASLLQTWLISHHNTSVINLAEPGALTHTALCASYFTPLSQYPRRKNMTLALRQGASKFIIAFPSNDTTHGINAEQTIKNILDLRQCAKNNNARIAVMSSLPRSGLSDQQNTIIQQIDATLLKEFGACFIQSRTALADKDNINAKREYSAGDGVHFNDAGHQALFYVVKNFIEKGECF